MTGPNAAEPAKDAGGTGDPLLRVEGLVTRFETRHGTVRAVDGVSFMLERGEHLGLVGESGSGKSVTAMSIMRLVPSPPGRITAGRVLFEGEDLLTADEARMRALRGGRLAMIFQDPAKHLDPIMRVGEWIAQALTLHKGHSRRDALDEAQRLLRQLKVASPEDVLHAFPFQLSGGMCQRVLIATAIATEPAMIIADEATSALDVTVQASILATLNALTERSGTAVLLTTHNMLVVRATCTRVMVMYAGRVVEMAPTERLFARPRHPYTAGLLGSIPALEKVGRPLIPLAGEPPPLPTDMPAGCAFFERCPAREAICAAQQPPLAQAGDDHWSACFFPEKADRSAHPRD